MKLLPADSLNLLDRILHPYAPSAERALDAYLARRAYSDGRAQALDLAYENRRAQLVLGSDGVEHVYYRLSVRA